MICAWFALSAAKDLCTPLILNYKQGQGPVCTWTSVTQQHLCPPMHTHNPQIYWVLISFWKCSIMRQKHPQKVSRSDLKRFPMTKSSWSQRSLETSALTKQRFSAEQKFPLTHKNLMVFKFPLRNCRYKKLTFSLLLKVLAFFPLNIFLFAKKWERFVFLFSPKPLQHFKFWHKLNILMITRILCF